ncbi:MAG: cell division protein ZapE [Alphaproteobacteria bacterium]|nr:cell division protein ZapE [Alphaproteobacteria bacterium]
MTEGPIFALRDKTRAGELEPDPAQELAAEKLQSLHNALKRYEPARKGSWKARFGLTRRTEEPPQGLYIFGEVGRGKSMLMDMFYASAPLEKRRRVHFHAFMLEVHETLHRWRQEGKPHGHVDDLLMVFADSIADEAWLLCFDEFHVTNIADAMLLGRLFQSLLDHGVIIVATSNWPPDELYKDGLQRELFLPFIDLIKERLDVLELTSPTDYRLKRLIGMRVYHVPLGPAADRALEDAFAQLADGATARADQIEVQGRTVPVPKTARGVAWFGFADLCAQPLGAADYLALAERYSSIVLKDIPRMGPEQRNEAKRFATLIDTLYEKKVRLVCSAAAAPQDLYVEGTGARDFERTVSRLMEMQSAAYVAGV